MCWWVVLLSVGAHAAELVFRVPEVMVRHAAADRPVGTVAARRNHYEEYFIEHSVSTADARRAAVALDLHAREWGGVAHGCGQCGRRERRYCESSVLSDHCCCERRYVTEPFPWLPHECFAGASRCRPAAADCGEYARLRDCCCRTQMAHRWKSILNKSSGAMSSPMLLIFTTFASAMAAIEYNII